MIPATPLKTKRQLQKGPAVFAIPIPIDGRKSAYPGAAIGFGLVRNWDRTLQNDTNYRTHFVIPLFPNSNPNKADLDRGVLTRNKTNMACCSGGNVVQMRNELRESSTRAYQT
jgi:hypothetical protein